MTRRNEGRRRAASGILATFLLAFAAAPAAGQGADAGAKRSTEHAGRPRAPARTRPRTSELPLTACSFEEPVCVHASERTRASIARATLAAAERAFAALDALKLPRPRPDASLGGTDDYDLYLERGAETSTTIDFLATASTFDESSAFTVLSPQATGCALDSDVARSIFEASILGLDAGAEDASIAMASSYFATLVAPCSTEEDRAVDDLQAHPELGVAYASRDHLDGALLFPWFLDDELGFAANAAVVTALLSVSAQRTPEGATHWWNEPDLFDALRENARIRDTTLDKLLADFSVARAFIGDRDDGEHLGDVARFGSYGRVRFEWSIPFASLPRRLAPLRPIEPTGASYVWLDLEGAARGAELNVVFDWEVDSLFHFEIVKVDEDGNQAGLLDVPAIYGATHAEKSVRGLDGLGGLIFVATNAGSPDRSHPFDPDDAPFIAHAYTITLYK